MSYTKITEQDLKPKGKRGRPPLPPPASKVCAMCNTEKEIKFFYHQPRSRYISSYCNSCTTEYHRQWNEKMNADPATYEKNKARIRRGAEAYRIAMRRIGISLYIPMQKRFEAIMQLI